MSDKATALARDDSNRSTAQAEGEVYRLLRQAIVDGHAVFMTCGRARESVCVVAIGHEANTNRAEVVVHDFYRVDCERWRCLSVASILTVEVSDVACPPASAPKDLLRCIDVIDVATDRG